MVISSTDVFDVPVALDTILNVRENSSWQRSLFIKNLSSSDLAIQLETSTDGGSSWSLIGTAFTLAAGEITVKEIPAENPNIFRVRASGGGDDRDLHITYARIFDDNQHNWVMPIT